MGALCHLRGLVSDVPRMLPAPAGVCSFVSFGYGHGSAMTNPQQPELARSRKGATSDDSVKSQVSGVTTDQAGPGPMGPVPEDNQPGHHPEVEQDKPEGPPPVPRARAKAPPEAGAEPAAMPAPQDDGITSEALTPVRLPFRFRPLLAPAAAAFGVTPWTAHVEVDDEELRVRFGPWAVRTPRSNIAGAERTGPYKVAKVAGGPHLSFSDGGATFATTTDAGVCIHFTEPVRALLPVGPVKHPALTVTVADPDRLVELLAPNS